MILKRTFLAVGLAVAVSLCSCHHLNDDRIPVFPVHVGFITVGDWNVSGIGGALEYKRFIKEEQIPSNYHFTAISATGFGGILLVGDIMGNPAAYDLSCPVECKRDIRIFVNTTDMVGECPKCHSTYDIFSLGGHPLSGPAANDGFGLRRYNVGPSSSEYMLISN